MAYRVALFVHVLAAIGLVGGGVAAQTSAVLAVRSSTVEGARAHVDWARAYGRATPVLAVLVVGAGLYLATTARLWSHGWPGVALAAFAVSAVLAPGVIDPALVRAGDRLDALDGGPATPGQLAGVFERAGTVFGLTLVGIDVAIVFLMTVKPAFGVSVAVATAGVVLGTSAGVGRHRALARVELGHGTSVDA